MRLGLSGPGARRFGARGPRSRRMPSIGNLGGPSGVPDMSALRGGASGTSGGPRDQDVRGIRSRLCGARGGRRRPPGRAGSVAGGGRSSSAGGIRRRGRVGLLGGGRQRRGGSGRERCGRRWWRRWQQGSPAPSAARHGEPASGEPTVRERTGAEARRPARVRDDSASAGVRAVRAGGAERLRRTRGPSSGARPGTRASTPGGPARPGRRPATRRPPPPRPGRRHRPSACPAPEPDRRSRAVR